MLIQLSEQTKLALNLTELNTLHLVVNRSDQWVKAVSLFHSHTGLANLQVTRRLPREGEICSTFDQLPVCPR